MRHKNKFIYIVLPVIALLTAGLIIYLSMQYSQKITFTYGIANQTNGGTNGGSVPDIPHSEINFLPPQDDK